MKGPKFLEYFRPLIEVLRENGGAGKTSEIIDLVIDKMGIPEEEIEETLKTGSSRVKNRIQFARLYLVKADLMDSGTRGLWKLTEKGYEASLNDAKVYALFKGVQKTLAENRGLKDSGTISEELDDIEEVDVEDESHRSVILGILKTLSPLGFEQICKRLLTEIGIENVQLSGQPNDKGIDGVGVIKLNDVVGFNIIFQCKRYKDRVSPSSIRDFRGTMQGRADKGIFMTTGRFTAESKNEAKRDGVPPIELIDGDAIVELFEKYGMGLKPKVVYDVVPAYFEKYK